MVVTPEVVRRVEQAASREGAALIAALQRLEPDGAAVSEELAGGMELIVHRLALAVQAGCDVAVSSADPGGDSERNLGRFGFALAYTEAFLTQQR